jgi:hypothetical protein
MNERDELARLLPELADRDLPSGRERRLQEHLMSQIEQDRPAAEPVRARRGHARRYAIATSAVAAAIAVAAGTGGFGLAGAGGSTGGTSGGRTASVGATPKPAALSPVARTFELAAQYASAKPFTPPRPNQWIFIKNHELSPGTLAKDKGENPDFISQTWRRVDGTRMAGVVDGRLQTWTQSTDYLAITRLPTEPTAMLAAVRARLLAAPRRGKAPVAADGGPVASDGKVFAAISRMLNDYLLPPATTAALMRAAALIPGVRLVPGTVDAYGHRAIAVGRIQDGWTADELLLDPDTYDFVGYRSVAATDHTMFTGPGALHIKKGEVQFITTRLAAVIVDRPGQTG